ncbi:transporter substrate-binding domain-containing protein [Terasakiella sp. A23]|uniref:substrate-binding periplasmic protein n=1 Tax=Terasakiella sp. FCG-A23 TaxID=3080561 RepID=UPI002954178D|nr:transporter substrate-binding domain-containing protein [Terasakiella sp. A23]MDV7339731.1 transporter substrate-binding domain-containing protein [Terasakiella sp. A23]
MAYTRRKIIQAGLAGAASLFCAPQALGAHSRTLKIVHHQDFAPFEYETDRKAIGIIPDILNLAFEGIASYDLTHESLPWKRAQTLVSNGNADGLTAYASRDRREYMNFSKTPLIHITPSLFFSASHPRIDELKSISTLNDLKQFDVVDLIGNSWAEETVAPHTPMKWFPEYDQIFKVLLSNRFDVHVALSFEMVKLQLKAFGYDSDALVSVKIPALIKPVPLYFGLRKSLPGSKNILKAFDEKLEQIKPQIKTIKAKHVIA